MPAVADDGRSRNVNRRFCRDAGDEPGPSGVTESPVDDQTYNLLQALTSKLEAIEAYEMYAEQDEEGVFEAAHRGRAAASPSASACRSASGSGRTRPSVSSVSADGEPPSGTAGQLGSSPAPCARHRAIGCADRVPCRSPATGALGTWCCTAAAVARLRVRARLRGHPAHASDGCALEAARRRRRRPDPGGAPTPAVRKRRDVRPSMRAGAPRAAAARARARCSPRTAPSRSPARALLRRLTVASACAAANERTAALTPVRSVDGPDPGEPRRSEPAPAMARSCPLMADADRGVRRRMARRADRRRAAATGRARHAPEPGAHGNARTHNDAAGT